MLEFQLCSTFINVCYYAFGPQFFYIDYLFARRVGGGGFIALAPAAGSHRIPQGPHATEMQPPAHLSLLPKCPLLFS